MSTKFLRLVKALITSIGILFTNQILYPTLMILFFLMITDYLSGMLAAKKEAIEHPNDTAYG